MKRLPLILALSLAACAGGMDRRTYLDTLVGQSETEIVRQLGVPARSYETGGHKFLAFVEQRRDYVAGGPFFFGGGFYGAGFGYGAAFPSEIVDRTCETTLDLAGGRVQGWALRGNACG